MNEDAPSGTTGLLPIYQLVPTAGTPHALVSSNIQAFCHTLICNHSVLRRDTLKDEKKPHVCIAGHIMRELT